jgi:hypothetical protein
VRVAVGDKPSDGAPRPCPGARCDGRLQRRWVNRPLALGFAVGQNTPSAPGSPTEMGGEQAFPVSVSLRAYSKRDAETVMVCVSWDAALRDGASSGAPDRQSLARMRKVRLDLEVSGLA